MDSEYITAALVDAGEHGTFWTTVILESDRILARGLFSIKDSEFKIPEIVEMNPIIRERTQGQLSLLYEKSHIRLATDFLFRPFTLAEIDRIRGYSRATVQ